MVYLVSHSTRSAYWDSVDYVGHGMREVQAQTIPNIEGEKLPE